MAPYTEDRADKAVSVSRREECDDRKQALWGNEERQAFITRSRDICDYILPHASSLLVSAPGQADERWRHIFDTAATEALDISVAGHMTYATPVGSAWLSLVLRDDPDLAKNGEVKAFLNELARRQINIGRQSNTESDFKLLTRDGLAFGGGASIVDHDDLYTIWHRYVPVGDYAIDTNFRGQVDTLYRELRVTLRVAAQEFGAEKLCAESQRRYAEKKNWNDPVHIVHAIEPREGGVKTKEMPGDDGKPMPTPANRMAWRSVYYERDARKDEGILRESGHRVFPVLAPRYDLQGAGHYGYGPGAIALSHVRALQHRHHRLAEVIDWQTKGLFTAPTAAQGQMNRWRPSGVVLIDTANPTPIKNVADNNADITALRADIDSTVQRIWRVMHADTFSLLSQIDPKDMVVDAVNALRQEKFDILGPLTARWINELARPWVDITYAAMEDKGTVPEIPKVLLEKRSKSDPEFESVLARAAKSHRIASLNGFTGYVGAVARDIDKRALHKLESFAMVNEAAEIYDVAPEMIASDEKAQERSDAEAQAQAESDAAAINEQKASALQKVGSVKTAEPNLVTAAISRRNGQPAGA